MCHEYNALVEHTLIYFLIACLSFVSPTLSQHCFVFGVFANIVNNYKLKTEEELMHEGCVTRGGKFRPSSCDRLSRIKGWLVSGGYPVLKVPFNTSTLQVLAVQCSNIRNALMNMDPSFVQILTSDQ